MYLRPWATDISLTFINFARGRRLFFFDLTTIQARGQLFFFPPPTRRAALWAFLAFFNACGPHAPLISLFRGGGARLAFYASLFEKQFFLTGSFAHANRVTLSERVGENLFAYAIFDIVLNGAFQRPCTKLYVISFRCNEFFGRVRD